MPWENTDFWVIFLVQNMVNSPWKVRAFGHPSTAHTDENMDKTHTVVNEDRQSNISEIANRLGLLYAF